MNTTCVTEQVTISPNIEIASGEERVSCQATRRWEKYK
jgi:hypothetical protein